MDTPHPTDPCGRVASLHLHPAEPGAQMQPVAAFEVVAQAGIREDTRYFRRLSRRTGQPSLRQVSLIAREELSEHAAALNHSTIAPGSARANVETEGLNLAALTGRDVKIGEAILRIREARNPCPKMDAVAPGLRARMEDGRQGVLAEVVQSGRISENDMIHVLPPAGT